MGNVIPVSYTHLTSRTIEPYLLVFQWSSWYVWGFCLMRQDYRLFKLNRMVDLECCQEVFDKRILPPVSYTHLDVYKRQPMYAYFCS